MHIFSVCLYLREHLCTSYPEDGYDPGEGGDTESKACVDLVEIGRSCSQPLIDLVGSSMCIFPSQHGMLLL